MALKTCQSLLQNPGRDGRQPGTCINKAATCAACMITSEFNVPQGAVIKACCARYTPHLAHIAPAPTSVRPSIANLVEAARSPHTSTVTMSYCGSMSNLVKSRLMSGASGLLDCTRCTSCRALRPLRAPHLRCCLQLSVRSRRLLWHSLQGGGRLQARFAGPGHWQEASISLASKSSGLGSPGWSLHSCSVPAANWRLRAEHKQHRPAALWTLGGGVFMHSTSMHVQQRPAASRKRTIAFSRARTSCLCLCALLQGAQGLQAPCLAQQPRVVGGPPFVPDPDKGGAGRVNDLVHTR